MIQHKDGTEISPHLRLRERFQLFAGVRPVKAFANAPQAVANAALLLNGAVETGFTAKQLRPIEFGGDMGTRAITAVISEILTA